MVGQPDTIDVLAAKTLLLSFKNLVVIDHLSSFINLTKLQLDNNNITKIVNLDNLVNLTWLDLSFNQITRIEGIEKLTKLTDLSLSHNNIEVISDDNNNNLKHLYNTLQCLTLSNNRITSIDEIKKLRPFTALRLLVLKDNPIHITNPEEYQLTVLAFLTQLVYFDYVAVEESARLKARDNKLDAVLIMESKEVEDSKKMEENETKLQRSTRNRTIGNCDGIERLWENMMEKDNEGRKLRGLVGVLERVSAYEAKVEAAVREYEEEMYGVGENKRVEEERVREAMDTINQRAEQECQLSIKNFTTQKKQLRAQYDQLLTHPTPAAINTTITNTYASPAAASSTTTLSLSQQPASSPLLPTLTALLNRYHTLLHEHISTLMRVQSGLTHTSSLLLAAFDSALHEWSKGWSTRTQSAFQVLLSISKQYHDGLHDYVAVLLESNANNANAGSNGGASNSSSSSSTGHSKDDSKQGDNSNKAVNGSEGRIDLTDATASGNTNSSNTSAPAAGGGRVLLSDKESLMSALSASRDCHDSLIMAKEDELREKEERDVKERLARWRHDMIEQNRARVAEIYEMKKREERVIEEMMEKLSGEDEEDDSDATEQR